HLLVDALRDLSPILNDEHLGRRLEEPLNLVAVFTHLLWRQDARRRRPLERQRCGHPMAFELHGGAVEIVGLTTPISERSPLTENTGNAIFEPRFGEWPTGETLFFFHLRERLDV